jgi:hypothetical protein
MKRWGSVLLVIGALLIASVVPSDAGGRHFHGGHFHGGPRVFVGLGFGPYWYHPYPYWYYPPPAYVYSPAPVVVQQPSVYVEQNAPAPAAPPTAQQYWYYCEPAGGYYPSVQNCAEPWVKVPARAQH